MTYQSTETCQIVIGDQADSGLVIHEGAVPRCGVTARSWHGQPARIDSRGPGTVNCGRCARCVR